MFDNEYCKIEYLENDNAVYLAWKKFSCGENYRKPTTYALELLRKYKDSNFIIDARNGFEDEKEDVEWGFQELLPAMGKTTCKKCIMIMNVVNNIEGEMDMWTKEFSKYFEVIHTTTVEDALEALHNHQEFEILSLRDMKDRNQEAATWFHQKWGVPITAYLDSIEECQSNSDGTVQWYIVVNNENSIIGGCGIIENDFHERKDLTPNLCALYVEEAYRKRKIAKRLLEKACEDMKAIGLTSLYLITGHDHLYERYDWNFLCMVKEDSGEMTRMYEKMLI